jgi:hypothetical protein
MERVEISEIGTGMFDNKQYTKKKIMFINNDDTNYLVKAQSYYTKDQKKTAKLNYKNSNK